MANLRAKVKKFSLAFVRRPKHEISPEHATQSSQDARGTSDTEAPKGYVITTTPGDGYLPPRDELPATAGAERTPSGSTRHSISARHDETNGLSVNGIAAQRQELRSNLASQPDYNDLRDEVTTELNKHNLGLDFKRNYIPNTRIQALVNKTKIIPVFPHATEEFMRFIVQDVPRTFLTTVLAVSDANNGLQAMQAFEKHHFTDARCLPVPKLTAGGEAGFKCNWSASKSETQCSTCSADHNTDAMTPLSPSGCEHMPELGAFHHSCWGISDFDTFFDKQWSFLLQTFDQETFKYEDIEEKRILPFLTKLVEDDDESKSTGNFGDVVQAIMLADYLVERSDSGEPDPMEKQSVLGDDGERTKTVAIKTLRHKDTEGYEEYSLSQEWCNEAAAYQELNDLNHQHIVKGLAAYRQHGKYNLLLEWADGKSLDEFWKLHEKPALTRELVRDLLKQLYGLTDALYAMHNKERAPSRHGSVRTTGSSVSRNVSSKPTSQLAPTLPTPAIALAPPTPEMVSSSVVMEVPKLELNEGETIQVDKDPANAGANGQGGQLSEVERVGDPDPRSDLRRTNTGFVNWRHGDIKPANILRFTNGGTWLGTLKLADLGRAKRHVDRTSYRPDIENDKYHTKRYQPPDLLLYVTTSRLYDIWSLGCVFFEAIVWLLYGLPEVWKLKRRTEQLEKKGTPFWTKKGLAGATVSQLAELWMKTMIEEDPECGPNTALGDLMRLVRGKMLVVKLPYDAEKPLEDDRTNAEGVRRVLEDILEKAARNEYVLTGADRSTIKPPPSGKPSSGANFLNVPGVGSSDNTEDPRNQYSHNLNDDWEVVNDEDFVLGTLSQVMPSTAGLSTSSGAPAAHLCPFCANFDPCSMSTFRTRTYTEIKNKSRQCELCAMLSRLIGSKLGPRAPVSLIRNGGWLQLESKKDLALRIFRTRESLGEIQFHDNYIPIGLLSLPEPADEQHIGILRGWITDCDKHGCVPQTAQVYCPRRLLFVGEGVNDPHLYLVETDSWAEKLKKATYIALSHPWGNPTEYDHFKSTKKNVSEFCKAIKYEDLPQNFQDAVTIARGLGVAYLWIDSICILQASDGDPGDFAAEKDRMQDIFSSAYCVIAACSAKGMSDGFLNPRNERKVLRLSQEVASLPQFFISELIDDFNHDVEYSPLNERGWVLQERALARRTIYFTDNQTYWECSNGIRCETLTRLHSDSASFLGDSDFPSKSQIIPNDHKESQTMGAQIFQFTNLYEQYSRRAFTHYEDKPVAISGLEQRLTKIFGSRSGAGIFENHRERWLLWKRADGVQTLKKTSIAEEDDTTRIPPSWSWMSYNGGITFLRPPEGRVTWNREVELMLTGNATTSWLSTPQKLSMRARVVTINKSAAAEIAQAIAKLNLPAAGSSRNISIIHDEPCDPEIRVEHYVVLGTFVGSSDDASRNFVLVVQPLNTKHSSVVYERVGTGWLPYSLVNANTVSSNMSAIV